MSNFYLYLHINEETNLPFYVGIGTKEPKNTFKGVYSRAYKKSSRSQYWKNYTNKYKYSIQILEESDNYEYIKQRERDFIKLYGKSKSKNGLLVNLTDGGEGVQGYKHSEETKRKMSIAKLGKKFPNRKKSPARGPMSDKQKGKISNSLKGHITSEETKNKLSKAFSKSILQYTLNNILVRKWNNSKEASISTNISQSFISRAASGMYNNKARKFLWYYE